MNRALAAALWVSGTIAAWIAYDVLLVKLGFMTESQVVSIWGQTATVFPFFLGCIVGHWFMNQRRIITGAWGYLIPFLLILGLWDGLWAVFHGPRVWYRYAMLWEIVGNVAGGLLWGQVDPESPIP